MKKQDDKPVPVNCPWCKRKPQIGLGKKTGCQLHGEPSQTITVHCQNKDCPVKPFVEAGNIYNGGKDRAVQKAVERWNTCAPPETISKKSMLSYISAAITVRRENTPEWMEYFVERTNEILKEFGETDIMFIRGNGEISTKREESK